VWGRKDPRKTHPGPYEEKEMTLGELRVILTEREERKIDLDWTPPLYTRAVALERNLDIGEGRNNIPTYDAIRGKS